MSPALSSVPTIGYSGRCFPTAALLMRKLFVLLLLLPLCHVSAVAAEPAWYRVEIVLFANTASDAGSEEAWPVMDETFDTDARQLATTGSGEPYARIPDSELKLGGVVQALRNSGLRKPLLHTGWRQPVYDRNRAQPVWIQGGPSLYLSDGRSVPEIAGTLMLTRSRFLHVWTNLRYAQEGFPTRTYVMRDHRRMRSGELHYVDHPMFGLLILCTPVERGS